MRINIEFRAIGHGQGIYFLRAARARVDHRDVPNGIREVREVLTGSVIATMILDWLVHHGQVLKIRPIGAVGVTAIPR